MFYIQNQKIVHYIAKTSVIFFCEPLFTFKPSCCIPISVSLKAARGNLTTVMAHQHMRTLMQSIVTAPIYAPVCTHMELSSGFTKSFCVKICENLFSQHPANTHRKIFSKISDALWVVVQLPQCKNHPSNFFSDLYKGDVSNFLPIYTHI